MYQGTEGELYDLREDAVAEPVERCGVPCVAQDLQADLYDQLPPQRGRKLTVEAPA